MLQKNENKRSPPTLEIAARIQYLYLVQYSTVRTSVFLHSNYDKSGLRNPNFSGQNSQVQNFTTVTALVGRDWDILLKIKMDGIIFEQIASFRHCLVQSTTTYHSCLSTHFTLHFQVSTQPTFSSCHTNNLPLPKPCTCELLDSCSQTRCTFFLVVPLPLARLLSPQPRN